MGRLKNPKYDSKAKESISFLSLLMVKNVVHRTYNTFLCQNKRKIKFPIEKMFFSIKSFDELLKNMKECFCGLIRFYPNNSMQTIFTYYNVLSIQDGIGEIVIVT